MFDKVEFLNPEFLYLLITIPIQLAWVILRNKNRAASILWPSSFLIPTQLNWKIILNYAVLPSRALALAALIIAISRPQTTEISSETLSKEGIDIILALDVSTSMLAEDFKPNRLEAAKQVAQNFINSRPSDRFGLVVYAGESFTQCPLTTDHKVVKNLLNEVKDGLIEDGTAIGMGLATSVSRLKDSKAKSKVIILLTDGENNSGFIDPSTAVEIAQESIVKVYTVGVGSYGKAPYPTKDLWGRDTYVNLDVKIDEKLLIEIADATGGVYFRADNKKKLEQIYQQIESMEKTELEELKYYNFEEKFEIFAFIALGLLFIEFILQYTLLKSIT
jgi:Ca-activated chloride channel family protein